MEGLLKRMKKTNVLPERAGQSSSGKHPAWRAKDLKTLIVLQ